MKKRVLIMLQSDFPPDVRLQKEIKTLVKQGYEIHLLCNNRKKRPRREAQQALNIHRMINVSNGDTSINRMITAPQLLNPLWIESSIRLILRYKIDVIHVVNLPLAPLAVLCGKIFHIPVIYDMYENYPEAIRSWNLSGVKRITRNPKVAQKLDDLCSRYADRIIVVVEEAKDRLKFRGFKDDKIQVISNTVDLEEFRAENIDQDIVKQFSEQYCIVYTGLFSPERGIETAIDSIPYLMDVMGNIKMILVGDGPSLNDVKKYVTRKNLNEYVLFTGWVDYQLFPTYVALAKICMIPQPSNPFIDTTIPNKLFEYMAMGKPVIASDAKSLKRIVRETCCGETFISGSPVDFADSVKKILGNEITLGNNGKTAIAEKYQWKFTEKELIHVYQSIEKEERLP